MVQTPANITTGVMNDTKALLNLLLSLPNKASQVTDLQNEIDILLDLRTNLQNQLTQNNDDHGTNLQARLTAATTE